VRDVFIEVNSCCYASISVMFSGVLKFAGTVTIVGIDAFTKRVEPC
jgi:hypothetical protein